MSRSGRSSGKLLNSKVPHALHIFLRPLRTTDADALLAAEDESTIRWLSGAPSSLEGIHAYVAQLNANEASGASKRAFAIVVDGACVGTIDFDADVREDGLVAGDVNIAYAVSPTMRGRGVAVAAVQLACQLISQRQVGSRAILRVDARNTASIRVAQKAEFMHLRDVVSDTETDEHTNPVVQRVFALMLPPPIE